jgi:ketosteroid isomerase-like protein
MTLELRAASAVYPLGEISELAASLCPSLFDKRVASAYSGPTHKGPYVRRPTVSKISQSGVSMNRTWTWCVVALLALGSAAWAQDKKSAETEQGVAALEQQWLQSQKTNNPDLVAALLADKFISTNNDGKVTDKAQSLATAKATKYDTVSYDDLKVTAFGNTAVATGVFKATGTDSMGKPLNSNERFTDTWLKMPNGKWQCIASHSSAIKM